MCFDQKIGPIYVRCIINKYSRSIWLWEQWPPPPPKKNTSSEHNILEDLARSWNLVPRKTSRFSQKYKFDEQNNGNKEVIGMMYSQEDFVPGLNSKVWKTINIDRCENFEHNVS